MKAILLLVLLTAPAMAQTSAPIAEGEGRAITGVGRGGKLPHITVDVPHRTVRVECESLAVDGPLEFLACVKGTHEYESVLRSEARPSHVHAALLMIGLTPGEPVHYDEEKKKYVPPEGPALKLSVEYQKDGKPVTRPANETMRYLKSKKPMPEVTWVFTGGRIMPDQRYAADGTGYLVSLVSFEYSPIDFGTLASSSNETLEWEVNKEALPPAGTPVVLILQPAEKSQPPPDQTPPKAPASRPAAGEPIR